ncbi:type I-F CRISPR-associated protein Csy1 [Actinobacillus pleuropneumoniae]|uniref:type I-F CRISPR-associated protein Csy1 n=1 Tax=Actinobacillus pleuropneumoniae TaxID=715 RepID=UPI00223D796C|nr:type I-F CRISPR-associated protein Csy1 [Actinobacillus pleuropneumoniae]
MITPLQIRAKIIDFLQAQHLKKSENDYKKLEKATEPEEIAKIKAEISKSEEKYRLDTWLHTAATEMAKQLKFGTHIAKGIHPDAKGNNINFRTNLALPTTLVGSQLIDQVVLDANGNAAALPLAAFFDIMIDEVNKRTLKDLLLTDEPCLDGCFSDDHSLSAQYKIAFQMALKGNLNSPETHERNKQVLWVNSSSAIEDNHYTCLIPLYPSSFTHAIYNKLNQARFSDENKQARENRYKNKAQNPYISIPHLAATKLGGTKPQNVSLLTSKQGGRNYLLPSLPPIFTKGELRLTNAQDTIFNDRLAYVCRAGLYQLYQAVADSRKNYIVRVPRAEAVNLIVQIVLQQACKLQKRTAGWSRDYQLAWCEKYWLDPQRAKLNGEEQFHSALTQQDWISDVEQRFAAWLNALLKKRFPKHQDDFTATEYNEWRKYFRKKLHRQLRHIYKEVL